MDHPQDRRQRIAVVVAASSSDTLSDYDLGLAEITRRQSRKGVPLRHVRTLMSRARARAHGTTVGTASTLTSTTTSTAMTIKTTTVTRTAAMLRRTFTTTRTIAARRTTAEAPTHGSVYDPRQARSRRLGVVSARSNAAEIHRRAAFMIRVSFRDATIIRAITTEQRLYWRARV